MDETQKEIIVKSFEEVDDAIPVCNLIIDLEERGYENAGEIIVEAIDEDILRVDSIDGDGTVYMAIEDEIGKELWQNYKI